MKSIKRALGIGAIVLALAGCDNSGQQKVPDHSSEYRTNPPAENVETVREIEGVITKVTPGEITYAYGIIAGGGRYQNATAANHQIEFVQVQTEDRTNHVLVYPFCKFIPEGKARLKFRPLQGGKTDVGTLVSQYISQQYSTDDNFDIEAEGIICGSGITYQQ
jgi:hypothetical protein